MTYRERPLPGFACAWSRSTDVREVALVVPDGRTDLIYATATGEVLVAGPDTVGHRTEMAPGTLHAVRFEPGVGPAALGVPAHVLLDQRVPLSELWGDTARLQDDLARADDPARVLAEAARARLRESPPDPVITALVRGRRASVGLSDRQVLRRSLDAFGYGPKVLHRVLRFDRAVALAWRGVPFADIAVRTGYADQAHLAREVKRLAGVTLGQLIRP
ncbi:AraC family transcriptional regulator [Actinosynnema sp. NPDC020468]|uniref:AraC family transcriptional regulator n=1 Tax=Actinosynnema sp. NPDC020468 TaxID=3154488 RepID=UPI0033FEECED